MIRGPKTYAHGRLRTSEGSIAVPPPTPGADREAHISTEHPQALQEPWFSTPDVHAGWPSHHQGPAPEGPASSLGLIKPVQGRDAFAALRRSGRRVRSGPLTLTFLAGASDDPPRVAYAIGRAVGGAVVRNRLRRRLRVVVSELGSVLRPGAYLIAAAPSAALLSSGELKTAVAEALDKLIGTPPR